MSAFRLASLEVSEVEMRRFSEAYVHSTRFEADMRALGFPARTRTQADGEYFREQGQLAIRRLKSRQNRGSRGHYDGLYLIGNSPVVLCEIKRYDAIDAPRAFDEAVRQLQAYATSEDFATPPPFLVLYCGKPSRNRFFRRRSMSDPALDAVEYEELGEEIWTWSRVKEAQVKGAFAEEVVDRQRLLDILLHHLDRIEDDLRTDVTHAVALVSGIGSPGLLSRFGRWLRDHPHAFERMQQLYERKVAELGTAQQGRVVEEMVTQAALNYLNKVFFLNLCEDRHLPGFYRIMREFLPATRSETTQTTAAVFLTMLRRKIRDTSGAWSDEEEDAYRALRGELASEIRDHVIEQNNWWELIRVAFDLAEERFPLIYREDAYDDFRPGKQTLAELVYDLSTKSFQALTNRHVGDIYQGLLSSRRARRQQARLGAFYTPRGDVDYMVGKLELRRDSKVLDPCMGSGHFLEGIYERLRALYAAEGLADEAVYRQIVGEHLFGGDIDSFATSLAAIRLFLLDEHGTRTAPNLFVHDMLLHSPERPGTELFTPEVLSAERRERSTAERAVSADPRVDEPAAVDAVEFDAVVGNPPYGARAAAYKVPVYRRLYGLRPADVGAGSIATGDAESYAMFFANGIERLREGGRLSLVTNDSFRTLTTHAALRRHVLDRCKIVEILLTDTRHFEGVSFQFAGMAITTLEKCSDARARAENVMRLVDYIRDPADYGDPPTSKVIELRQAEYDALPETPFFVGVPNEVFNAAKRSHRVRDVARGRQGLATADDRRFLAGVGEPFPRLDRVIAQGDLAIELPEAWRDGGIPSGHPQHVPFAKGEGAGEYYRPPRVAIDWSQESVRELERRDRQPAGTPRRPRFQNRQFYFRLGLTYSVVGSGRLSVRLMPAGWIFGHKGSAIFAEDGDTSDLFLLGYLNSALATYFLKRLVNTTATADVGYIEKLPYRRPPADLERYVVERVERIVTSLRAGTEQGVEASRGEIDDAVFDLFDIRASRDEIRQFHATIGRVERPDDDAVDQTLLNE